MRRLIVGIVAYLVLLPSDRSSICGRAVGAQPESPILAEFEFDPGEQVLRVPVSVGTDQYRFGLATANCSFFGKAFANKLARLPAELDFTDDPDENYRSFVFRSAPRASIGPLMVHFPRPYVTCGHLASFGGHFLRADGVIGLDVLIQQIVQIDFDNGKIRFLRSVPKDAGDRFEITSLQKRPRARAVTIKAQCGDGAAEDFYVDLENPDEISIRSPVYCRLFETKQLRRVHDESTFGNFRFGLCRVGIASSFSMGRFRTMNVRTIVNGDNIIGLEYLSRYTVTFDFPSGFMYMRPGKQFDRAAGIDVSGLYAKWMRNSLVVSHCETGSPAEEAGLQEYDVILAVDGQPVCPESQSTFRRQIRQEGRTLRIHFKRGELHQNANLKLQAVPGRIIDEIDLKSNSSASDVIFNFPPRDEPPELWELPEPDEPQTAAHERSDVGQAVPNGTKARQKDTTKRDRSIYGGGKGPPMISGKGPPMIRSHD